MNLDNNTSLDPNIQFKTPRKIEILFKISLLPNIPRSVSEIEKSLGYNSAQPDIREIAKTLITLNILELKDCIFGVKRYKINHKKLTDFIDELDITKLILGQYATTAGHIFVW